MNWKQLAKGVAYWTVPTGFQDALRTRLSKPNDHVSDQDQAILNRNRELQTKHRGERCFVLATGPSIREQDLRPLQNEWCIAVSEFYKHQHYQLIKPEYYAFAPTTVPLTEQLVAKRLQRLQDVKRVSRDEIFFFALHDKSWAETSNLVEDRNRIYYLRFSHHVGDPPARIELASSLPFPFGASVLGIWVAIYLGFSEIYLVGCDHDGMWRWDGVTPFTHANYPHHFYDGPPVTGYEGPLDVDVMLKSFLVVKEAYRACNRLALERGTRIYNANPRNYLNVFPRVTLATLFS
jgi:hypothetical protein